LNSPETAFHPAKEPGAGRPLRHCANSDETGRFDLDNFLSNEAETTHEMTRSGQTEEGLLDRNGIADVLRKIDPPDVLDRIGDLQRISPF
jgi:hypothetical protein